LPDIPNIGRVFAGTPVLDEGNIEGCPEINRLAVDRPNLFVLQGKGDLVSDLRERQLWRTPE
jgi:SOS-response transcriptional repressor LexA